MDYTQIILAIIALITAVLTSFVIPWLKEKYGAEKLQKWQGYVDIAVQAAEQLFSAEKTAEKKAYVLNYLAAKGIKFDSVTVENMIESSVLLLHAQIRGEEVAADAAD